MKRREKASGLYHIEVSFWNGETDQPTLPWALREETNAPRCSYGEGASPFPATPLNRASHDVPCHHMLTVSAPRLPCDSDPWRIKAPCDGCRDVILLADDGRAKLSIPDLRLGHDRLPRHARLTSVRLPSNRSPERTKVVAVTIEYGTLDNAKVTIDGDDGVSTFSMPDFLLSSHSQRRAANLA